MVRFDRWMKTVNNLNWDDALNAVGLTRKSQASGAGTFFLGMGLGLLGGAAADLLLTPYKAARRARSWCARRTTSGARSRRRSAS